MNTYRYTFAAACPDMVREALDALDTLEAQLEAIGAGGVSGPLVGRASLSANAWEPAAYLIDWPDDPELGHYFSESPPETGRCRPLYLASPPTAQAEGWISVEDRLPAKNTEVLICFAESTLPSTGQYTGHAADPAGWCYPKESYLWPGESEKLPDGGAPTVTHWMPLPPLPHHAETAKATRRARLQTPELF